MVWVKGTSQDEAMLNSEKNQARNLSHFQVMQVRQAIS